MWNYHQQISIQIIFTLIKSDHYNCMERIGKNFFITKKRLFYCLFLRLQLSLIEKRLFFQKILEINIFTLLRQKKYSFYFNDVFNTIFCHIII